MGRNRATTGRNAEQVTIRLPDGMRDELNRLAEENNRFANGEIVNRLSRSLNPRESPEYELLKILIEDEFRAVRDEMGRLASEMARLTALLSERE
jgi:HAMP domain-containing protein